MPLDINFYICLQALLTIKTGCKQFVCVFVSADGIPEPHHSVKMSHLKGLPQNLLKCCGVKGLFIGMVTFLFTPLIFVKKNQRKKDITA